MLKRINELIKENKEALEYVRKHYTTINLREFIKILKIHLEELEELKKLIEG